MLNVMANLPNIGGALCSSIGYVHNYWLLLLLLWWRGFMCHHTNKYK